MHALADISTQFFFFCFTTRGRRFHTVVIAYNRGTEGDGQRHHHPPCLMLIGPFYHPHQHRAREIWQGHYRLLTESRRQSGRVSAGVVRAVVASLAALGGNVDRFAPA